jgi:alpha-glucosidase
MIAELVLPPARAVAYHGADLDEAHMPHNFALTELPEWTADAVRAEVEAYEAVLPEAAWPNWLLGDHDFPRIATRVGPERVRLLHMLLLTLRGTPTWYYGDELGLPNAVVPTSKAAFPDPQAALGTALDRLPVRSPMQWSSGPNAGFSDSEPWLPLASDDPAMTVDAQREDSDSVLNLFRALVRLRKETPALAVGVYRTLPAPDGVFSFERSHSKGTVQVHLNFADEPREVDVPPSAEVLLSTEGEGSTPQAGRLALRGYEGAIVSQPEHRGREVEGSRPIGPLPSTFPPSGLRT